MLARMGYKQFLSWKEYDKIEPFGGERLDWLFAHLIASMVNSRRNTDKYPDPFPISDFVIKWGKGEKKAAKPKGKSWQELKLIGMMCAAAFNAFEDREAAKQAVKRQRMSKHKR